MSNRVNRIELLGQNKVGGKRETHRFRRGGIPCKQLVLAELIKIYISPPLCLLASNKTIFNHQLVFNYKVFIPLLNKN